MTLLRGHAVLAVQAGPCLVLGIRQGLPKEAADGCDPQGVLAWRRQVAAAFQEQGRLKGAQHVWGSTGSFREVGDPLCWICEI